MKGITIKVEPDVLKAKAASLDSRISTVEKELKSIADRIDASKNDWAGEAGTMHRRKFMALQGEMVRVISGLKKHPENLLTMAGLYSVTESGLRDMAGQLSGSVIR